MGRNLTRLLVLAAALALVVPNAAGAGPQVAPAAAQAPAPYRLATVGDMSPPTNETRGDDHAVAELLATVVKPDGILTLGDNQYEYGQLAMYQATTGFAGSYGRLAGDLIIAPTIGNHDFTDGGNDGRAPGFSAYFAPVFSRLEANAAAGRFPAMSCRTDPTPCHPEQGWYGVDLDADRDGTADWYVVAVATECARAAGSTGDSQSPSCANDSPQVNWMRSYMAARHGGATSGRKASLLIGHHEPFGTCFFADDKDSAGLNRQRYILQVWQHFHGDVSLRGHTHSTGRQGPTLWDGTPSTSGSRHIASGAGGRSLTPCRVNPPRPGTRYRDATRYGVQVLSLTVTKDPAGWQGGSWAHAFVYADGTTADAAAAGIWP